MSTQAYDGPAPVCAVRLSSCLFAPTHAPQPLFAGTTQALLVVASRLMCYLSCVERPSAFVLPTGHFHVYPFTPSSEATSSVRPSLTSSSLTGRITHFFSEVKKHFLHYSVFCFDLFCLRFCLAVGAQVFWGPGQNPTPCSSGPQCPTPYVETVGAQYICHMNVCWRP